MSKLFFAYPNEPFQIGQTIEAAIKEYNLAFDRILSWKAMDILGNFIPEEIFDQISNRTLVADITFLNANVVYEIGYAIGQKKFILLTRNIAVEEGRPAIQEVGLFDTLGYATYENSEELLRILKANQSNQPFKGNSKQNLTAPVYLMETQYKTDVSSRIISRINKAKLYYRSFDPSESPRLSSSEAIRQVSDSYGIALQLLSKDVKNSAIHNIRASFIAGLARGMNIPTRILQHGFDPIPIDYRDNVDVFKKLDDIDVIIAEFVNDVVSSIQEISPSTKNKKPTFLESLDLGASAAENEMRTLQNYYLRTDAFLKVSRGEVQLVTGRKGTGKSAIFFQINNKERGSSKNLVLDLQPEGYKLIKLKEQVLDYLVEGTFQHTIMAFWEYLLLLEVANKILAVDKARHLTNEKIREPYRALEKAYQAEDYTTEGDFSERMSRLIDRLEEQFLKNYGTNGEKIRLSNPEVTGLIHKTNIKELKSSLSEYLKHKDKIWILFDNIDKGWSANGLTSEDLIIIRTLIDASRNLNRHFEKGKIQFFPVIFLRSDVYHLLVLSTSDRQKEAKVSLDWIDQDLLKRLIELRIVSNESIEVNNDELDFIALWREICVSHYKGEDSFQFIIDRSLMRPRFLLNFRHYSTSTISNLI